jgi:hypothetical protein
MAKDKGRAKSKKAASVKNLPERTLTTNLAKAVKGGQAVRQEVRSILTQSPSFQPLPTDERKKISDDM